MAIAVSGESIIVIIIRFLINYAVRFTFAAIVVYCCWVPFQGITNWFSWHVILCTVAYIPLMAESLMLFVGDELWSKQLSRKSKYGIHAFLITLATIFAIVGNALVFHYLEPGYHLYTTHGITGLVSMIILILSIPLGVAVNNSEQLKGVLFMRPVWFKLIHNVVGLLGYAIGIVSLCYAYYTNWFIYYNEAGSRLAALIATIIVSVWSINGAVVSLYNQIKNALS